MDYEAALQQVEGDTEFLKEIMQDLLGECKTAEDDIASGITDNNYTKIMQAAHRIKGSASYLFCDKLTGVSLELQNLGRNGETSPSEELMTTIKAKYEIFKESLNELRVEIAKACGEEVANSAGDSAATDDATPAATA